MQPNQQTTQDDRPTEPQMMVLECLRADKWVNRLAKTRETQSYFNVKSKFTLNKT